MIIRSKAPLRIGLAGGGTDVSPYSDIYGGCILNVTINKYAYATIIPRKDDKIILHAMDREERIELQATSRLEIDGQLDLLKGCITVWFATITTTHLCHSSSIPMWMHLGLRTGVIVNAGHGHRGCLYRMAETAAWRIRYGPSGL